MPLRNSLHRRTHKERSQLAHRSKLGLLEKHKDYVLRARDYRSKRDRIRTLKLKAETRNRDEFYFGMSGKKTEKGVEYRQRGDGALSEEMVKVLKSQDEGYLRTVRKKGQKRIDAIKAQLTAMVDLVPQPEDLDDLDEDVVQTLRAAGILPSPGSRSRKGKGKAVQSNLRHIVFVDNEEDVKNYAGPSGTAQPQPNDDEWVSGEEGSEMDEDEGSGMEEDIEDEDEDDDEDEDEDKYAPQRAQKQEMKRQAQAKKHRLSLLQELAARLKRDTALRHALRELELQRHLMAPGARTKIRGPERIEPDEDEEEDGASRKKRGEVKFAKQGDVDYAPRVYKWRSERKR